MKYLRRQKYLPRDIGVILNKVIEEKTEGEEGIKQQYDTEKNWEQEQQLHLFPHKPTNSLAKVRLH